MTIKLKTAAARAAVRAQQVDDKTAKQIEDLASASTNAGSLGAMVDEFDPAKSFPKADKLAGAERALFHAAFKELAQKTGMALAALSGAGDGASPLKIEGIDVPKAYLAPPRSTTNRLGLPTGFVDYTTKIAVPVDYQGYLQTYVADRLEPSATIGKLTRLFPEKGVYSVDIECRIVGKNPDGLTIEISRIEPPVQRDAADTLERADLLGKGGIRCKLGPDGRFSTTPRDGYRDTLFLTKGGGSPIYLQVADGFSIKGSVKDGKVDLDEFSFLLQQDNVYHCVFGFTKATLMHERQFHEAAGALEQTPGQPAERDLWEFPFALGARSCTPADLTKSLVEGKVNELGIDDASVKHAMIAPEWKGVWPGRPGTVRPPDVCLALCRIYARARELGIGEEQGGILWDERALPGEPTNLEQLTDLFIKTGAFVAKKGAPGLPDFKESFAKLGDLLPPTFEAAQAFVRLALDYGLDREKITLRGATLKDVFQGVLRARWRGVDEARPFEPIRYAQAKRVPAISIDDLNPMAAPLKPAGGAWPYNSGGVNPYPFRNMVLTLGFVDVKSYLLGANDDELKESYFPSGRVDFVEGKQERLCDDIPVGDGLGAWLAKNAVREPRALDLVARCAELAPRRSKTHDYCRRFLSEPIPSTMLDKNTLPRLLRIAKAIGADLQCLTFRDADRGLRRLIEHPDFPWYLVYADALAKSPAADELPYAHAKPAFVKLRYVGRPAGALGEGDGLAETPLARAIESGRINFDWRYGEMGFYQGKYRDASDETLRRPIGKSRWHPAGPEARWPDLPSLLNQTMAADYFLRVLVRCVQISSKESPLTEQVRDLFADGLMESWVTEKTVRSLLDLAQMVGYPIERIALKTASGWAVPLYDHPTFPANDVEAIRADGGAAAFGHAARPSLPGS